MGTLSHIIPWKHTFSLCSVLTIVQKISCIHHSSSELISWLEAKFWMTAQHRLYWGLHHVFHNKADSLHAEEGFGSAAHHLFTPLLVGVALCVAGRILSSLCAFSELHLIRRVRQVRAVPRDRRYQRSCLCLQGCKCRQERWWPGECSPPVLFPE